MNLKEHFWLVSYMDLCPSVLCEYGILNPPPTPSIRAAIFLRLANLLATKYRPMVIATTMVGQGKTILQAEIDATCELIDFYRFAVQFAMDVYKVSLPDSDRTLLSRLWECSFDTE